ncbi:hypothetical protein KBI23_03760 [bacterium]|nr:hypothetical protein [bacterium]MBP9810015.1 hypothetical protein [bacterium]
MPRESFDRESTQVETWNKTKVHIDDKGARVEVQNGDCLWQIAHDAVTHQSPDKKAKSHQINQTIDDIKKENPGKVARDGTIHPTSAKGDYLDLPPIFAQQPDNKANKPAVAEQKETPKPEQDSKAEAKPEAKAPVSAPESDTTQFKAPVSTPDTDAAPVKPPLSASGTDAEPAKAPASATESTTAKADVPTGYGAVADAVAAGAVEEITEHPVKVAVIAAGTAVVTGVAAALVAPEVIVAAGIAGVGYGAYVLYEKAADWVKAADVVANGNEHSAEERAKSEKELKAIGAGTVDLAAGGIGGLAKGAIARTTSSAIGKFTGSATDEIVTAASTKIGQSSSPFDLGKKLPDEIAAMPLGRPRSEAIRNMVDPPAAEATAASSATSAGSKALVDTHLPAAIRDLPPGTLKSTAVRTYVEGQQLPANSALLDRSLPKEIMDLPPAHRAELIRAMAGDTTPPKPNAASTANDSLTLTSDKVAAASQTNVATDLAGKQVLPPKHWPEGIVDKVEAPIPPGHTRLYRGVTDKGLEGEFKVPLNQQEGRRLDELLMDPNIDAKGHAELLKLVERRKADGKYYSDYKDTALDYAGANGKVLYVDVPTREAASYSVAAGMMPDGKGGGSFYVPYQHIRNAREHAQSPTNHLSDSASRSKQ